MLFLLYALRCLKIVTALLPNSSYYMLMIMQTYLELFQWVFVSGQLNQIESTYILKMIFQNLLHLWHVMGKKILWETISTHLFLASILTICGVWSVFRNKLKHLKNLSKYQSSYLWCVTQVFIPLSSRLPTFKRRHLMRSLVSNGIVWKDV